MSMFVYGSSSHHRTVASSLILLVFLTITADTNAYTPESPEVQEMVQKAANFLATDRHDPTGFGEQCLIGLALVKASMPSNHERITRNVERIRTQIKRWEEKPPANTVYQTCVALLFLAEYDPEEYRPEIKKIMELLLKWQKDFGGWGYLEGEHVPYGDTSMTQYAVLSTWLADRTGAFKADVKSVIDVGNWLIRTQDPSGGWGYQGKDPGSFTLVEQEPVQNSLSAAGIGSLYMVADILRLTKGSQNPVQQRQASGSPVGLRKVVKTRATPKSIGPLTENFDTKQMRATLNRGDAWMNSNFTIYPDDWPFYYLYALERYHAFKELAEGKLGASGDGPGWYNQGVRFLRQNQQEDGRWSMDYKHSVDTSFGILFLTRGTQKTIMKAEGFGGRLRGGRGLPSNTEDVTVGADGSITKTAFQGKAETLLSLLESAALEDLDTDGRDFKISLSDDPQQRYAELVRLRRLVAADEYQVRVTALKALAASGELDNVPTYVFALSDPDNRVVLVARNALRSLSRKFNGFGLSESPTEGEKIDAIKKWKEWYLSIRPKAQFLN